MTSEASEALDLARSLISIESTTGNEAAVSDFLHRYLLGRGWQVETIAVAENRWNLFARKGTPRIAFSTHMDTVPPVLPSGEDEDFLYGRGACDAKGILAAQIIAAEQLSREEAASLCLLFVVGEERNSAGAIAANRWVKSQPFAAGLRYLINGEPTENRLALGTKGSLRCTIEAAGRSAHSAYPELGENAIEKLLDALQLIRRLPLRSHPELGKETVNIGTISGGTRPNIIPDHAEAEVMFRLVCNPEALKEQIAQNTGSLAQVRFDFEVPVVLLKRLADFDSAPMAYTTDIPFLTNFGEPLLLGPGSIQDAHSVHEKISKKELLRGVELYAKLVRILLMR
ncbi:MAG TPA: M20/M25/M40 family metallo-hydrolase [Acidobacteriota bacterium]